MTRPTLSTWLSACLAIVLAVALPLLSPHGARADTYSVGPSGTYRQLGELPTLRAGDIVEVEGGATYDAVSFRDHGATGDPIIVRGVRSSGGERPILMGGTNTIELQGDHYVLEGFEITGGTSRCVFHHADDIVIRDVVIHDCPRQGLLGADEDSGSLLLEYSEIYRTGEGDRSHQIYMSTDQLAHPGSVFRMQFCYLHDGNGGNGVKSRAERNEIYYNWIEGSYYHDLELIGPDPGGTSVAEDAHIEHSDVVGNVFVKNGLNPDHYTVRFGGDATGQSNARYRFVYNTVVLAPGSAGVFRLFDGIESLEAHNNVIFQTGSGDAQIVRDAEAEWVGGTRRVAGSHNWVVEGTGVRDLPGEWTGTLRGADPMFESVADHDLRPTAESPLVDAADPSSMPVSGYDFPSPETVPRFMPPTRVLLAVGTAVARPMAGAALDIGAFEYGSGPPVVTPDGGMMTCEPSCDERACGNDGCGGSCGSCDAPMVCSDGACADECAAGLTECDGVCVDLTRHGQNCGACNAVCGDGEMCVASSCVSATGRDGGTTDGAEDDEGCGCRAAGARARGGAPLGVAFALALGLGLALARRRARRPSA